MVLLSFYLGTHDSSVAAAVDGQVRYRKSERVLGIKHHRASLAFVLETCAKWQLPTPDAVAFSDGNRNQLGTCPEGELAIEVQPFLFNTRTYCLDHHYTHVLSAWPVVDLDSVTVGIAIDGKGDNGHRLAVIRHPGWPAPVLSFASKHYTFGALFYEIGKRLGLGGESTDFAGKLMGLHAFGNVDGEFVMAAPSGDTAPDMLDLLHLPWRGSVPMRNDAFFNLHDQTFLDWLASVHRVVEHRTLAQFSKWLTPNDIAIYAGGCANNVVVNARILQQFPQVHIPPHAYDGGLSLGGLEFLRRIHAQPAFERSGFPFWQDGEDGCRPPRESTLRHVCERLCRGQVVAWFQGKAEIGPRALGHRSILLDPRLPNGKQVLNERVKHREYWRPYGASVLTKYSQEWFGLAERSPFMLRSTQVCTARRQHIPGIVHADGSCRPQTVDCNVPGPIQEFARLIELFNASSGIPAILNTSLNTSGEPLYNNPNQALALLKSGRVDALCIGDELIG